MVRMAQHKDTFQPPPRSFAQVLTQAPHLCPISRHPTFNLLYMETGS